MKQSTYNICIEMLQQRGYSNISRIENEPIILSADKENGEKMCVIFADNVKINVTTVRDYISFMENKKIIHSIIIYTDKPTAPAKKSLEESGDMIIELFEDIELCVNITKHETVPRHTRLSLLESKEFKEKYGTKFPIIKSDDPISKFYFYQKGDIIEIEDDDIIYYRIVR
jgi:DNA-directed RNA polymerase subunit H (RpoH/RPB5)